MGNGIWTSGRSPIRGASAREFDQNSPDARGNWDGKVFAGPLSHGREFTKDEIWENYTYFIKQVAPVAEEVGVHIGIHPDDPPVPVLAGVPRCIFSNFEGYKRAMEIANSPNVGICLCCGTWLEGGKKLTGKDPEEMIRYFGAKKIWKIHFRNVSAPLPHFVETFMDDGYYDMWKIMKALRDVYVRRHRHPGPQPDDGRRELRADSVRLRLHESAAESRQRRSKGLKRIRAAPSLPPVGSPRGSLRRTRPSRSPRTRAGRSRTSATGPTSALPQPPA